MDSLNHTNTSERTTSKGSRTLALMSLVGALTLGGEVQAQANPDPVYLSVGTKIEAVTRPVREKIGTILDQYGTGLGIVGGIGIVGLGVRRWRNRRKEEDFETSFLESSMMPEYFQNIDPDNKK